MLACAFVAQPAWAQLPIPNLEDAPSFSLASADTLFDTAETLAESLAREIEARRAALTEQDPEPLSETDRQRQTRLRALREEELQTLEEALELAKKAAIEARAPVDDVTAASVEELVERRIVVGRLRAQAEARAKLAERLEAVTALEPSGAAATGSVADAVDEQTWRVQVAQAERARARAVLAAALARRAERSFEEARGALEVGGADVARAEAGLSSLAREVSERRAALEAEREELRRSIAAKGPGPDEDIETWASGRRAAHELALARYDLIGRREDLLEARRLRAQARLEVVRALANEAPVQLAGELSRTRIQTLLAKVEEQSSSTRLHLVEARQSEPEGSRAGRRAASLRREALEETLDVLERTREELEAIQLMRELGETATGVWRPATSWPLAWIITALALVLTFVVLRYGGRYVERRVIAEDGLLHRRLGFGEAARRRVATTFLILWPLVVLLGAAVGLLYGLWGLRLSVSEVVQWVDRPIFYIDQSPFSALSVVKLVFTLWVTFVLARALKQFLNQRFFTQLTVDRGLSNALSTFIYYLVLLIGLVVGLNVVGIGFSSLAVLLGVLGLGIGFGLRNITENFISGLIILAERPIQHGDFIDIDGRVEGQVRNIRARSTTVTTRDNINIIIPNSEFVGKQVTNWSHGDPKVRLNIPVGVVYGSDTDLVRKTLIEVAARHGKVLKRPPPEVQFRAFGDSSLDFLLLVWIEEQYHRFRISSDLHFAIDKAFRKAGLVIAFPQLDLHLMSVSDKARAALVQPVGTDADAERSRADALAKARREKQLDRIGRTAPGRAGSGTGSLPASPATPDASPSSDRD